MVEKNSDIEDRLDEIEKKLIEQEHRTFNILSNFILRRRLWPKNDSKRRAATVNFYWKLFFSPTTLATVGGSVGLLSLLLLYWQTNLLKQQNNQLENQITLQSETYKAARRTDLITYLNSDNGSIRQSAFLEFYSDPDYYLNSFIQIDSLRLRNVSFNDFDYANLKVELLELDNFSSRGLNMNQTLNTVDAKNSVFENFNFRPYDIDYVTLDGSIVRSSSLTFDCEFEIVNSAISNSKLELSALDFSDETFAEGKLIERSFFFNDSLFLGTGNMEKVKTTVKECVFIGCYIMNNDQIIAKKATNNIFINCHFDILFLDNVVDSLKPFPDVSNKYYDNFKLVETTEKGTGALHFNFDSDKFIYQWDRQLTSTDLNYYFFAKEGISDSIINPLKDANKFRYLVNRRDLDNEKKLRMQDSLEAMGEIVFVHFPDIQQILNRPYDLDSINFLIQNDKNRNASNKR